MTENTEKIISEVTAKDSQVLCREVMSITVHHASGVLVFYVHGHMSHSSIVTTLVSSP